MVELLDNEVFRLKEHSTKLADHRVRDFRHIYLITKKLSLHSLLFEEDVQEGGILVNDRAEDLDGHLLLETRRDHSDEALELALLRFGTDCEYEESSDLFLEERGQVHVFHSGVGNIDLFLELGLFSTAHLRLDSHVTEQPGIENSKGHEDERANHDFDLCSWRHLVATQKQNAVVEADEIFVPVVFTIETVDLWVDAGPREI